MRTLEALTALNNAMDAMQLCDGVGPASVMGPMDVNLDGMARRVMMARLHVRGGREKAFCHFFRKITGMGIVETGRLRRQGAGKARHLFIPEEEFARLDAGQIKLVQHCVQMWDYAQKNPPREKIAA